MFQSAVLQPEFEYAGHNRAINALCYNRHQDCFITADDRSMRLWKPTITGSDAKNKCTDSETNSSKPHAVVDIRHVALNSQMPNFIQALVYIDTRQLYVASTSDGALKIYDTELNELASVPTGRSIIKSLVYDSKHCRLFGGGIDGCMAWEVRGKPLTTRESMLNPLYELAGLCKFFHTMTKKTSGGSPKRTSKGEMSPRTSLPCFKKRVIEPHEISWIHSVQLNTESSRLYAQGKYEIHVFSTTDGQRLDLYQDFYSKDYGPMSSFVLHEKTQYMICGCITGALCVFSTQPLTMVHLFKDHSQAITSLVVLSTSHLILSSSLDGTVRLWDLEARRQAHRLDLYQPVYNMALLTPNRFYCRVRSLVHLFRVQSTLKEHLSTLSPISILQRTIYSHDQQWIIAACMDKTIRLFQGKAPHEAPSFTWIPEQDALDMIGLTLDSTGQHLYLLMQSEQIVVINVLPHEEKEGEMKEETSVVERIIKISKKEPTTCKIRCITCCYYPPLFTSHIVVPEKTVCENARTRRTGVITQSVADWIVCGSEDGQLIFWHTRLSNSLEHAIYYPAHKAPIVSIGSSLSSPLIVTLDALQLVSIWESQPVFQIRQMIQLDEVPTCFQLSLLSELLVTGDEDGTIIFRHIDKQIETYQTDENHRAMIMGIDFLETQEMVLTASVDAMIYLWDYQKVLLRQIQMATGLTSVCFMNAQGDVLTGFASGIFVLSRQNVLPDKVPTSPRRGKEEKREKHPLLLWHPQEEEEEEGKESDGESNSDIKELENVKISESQEPERIENEVNHRMRWKRQSISSLHQAPPLQLTPPILRKELIESQNRIESSLPIEGLVTEDRDWRDVIIPPSLYQKALRASSISPPIPSQQPKPILQKPHRLVPHSPVEKPSLAIGKTASLDYAKHQTPVPPKATTPRKLWNAMGGQSRRLLAMQQPNS